ncbi:MAG: phospholipase effector Tle1 domain-containing protein, partial [Acidiferrobacterales bacterium]
AIDDERLTFHPTLWDAEIKQGQTIKQVWFCGMHTDVGGGYAEQGLSDIALAWMVKEATDNGLLIFGANTVVMKSDPDGMMHDSRGGFLEKLYRKKARSWNAQTHGKPVVHESVLERTLNKNNMEDPPYAPWILVQTHDVES